jgi:hypothetical protein
MYAEYVLASPDLDGPFGELQHKYPHFPNASKMPSIAVNEDLPKYMLNISTYIVKRLRNYRFHCVKKDVKLDEFNKIPLTHSIST